MGVVLIGEKSLRSCTSTPDQSPVAAERPSLQPAAQLAEQHHSAHSTGVFFKNTFQPLLFEPSPDDTPLIPPGA